MSNFGEIFKKNVLQEFYAEAIAPQITNEDYEGEIKKAGDRLNILSFVEDMTMSDYTKGTDMTYQHMKDNEDVLIVNKKKYYNFPIDITEDLFTYVEDLDSALIKKAKEGMKKVVDQDIMKRTRAVKCGHWVGSDVYQPAAKFAGLTTAGVLTMDALYGIGGAVTTPFADAATEVQDKGVYISAFTTTTAFANPHNGWFRISVFTSSIQVTITEWNDYTVGTLPGAAFGAQGADYSDLTFEAVGALQPTASTIYGYVCDLAGKLDEDSVPATDRYLVIPVFVKTLLIQASQLQPDITIYHDETVRNGVVGQVAGFKVIVAPDDRFNRTTDISGYLGFECLGCHKDFITFGDKYQESRIMPQTLQFANNYQGLYLWGCTVAIERRKCGAVLYVRK